MSEWQPIETAPKDGSVILVAHKRGTWNYPPDQNRIRCVVVCWHKDRFDEFGPDSFRESELEYWMPFPAPPAMGITRKQARDNLRQSLGMHDFREVQNDIEKRAFGLK